MPHVGPVTVVLGQYGEARSIIRSPEGVNYFKVELEAGQTWNYAPPSDHTVGWVAVYEGTLLAPAPIATGTIAVFDQNRFVTSGHFVGSSLFIWQKLTTKRDHFPFLIGHFSFLHLLCQKPRVSKGLRSVPGPP